jgi:hypothetical protein
MDASGCFGTILPLLPSHLTEAFVVETLKPGVPGVPPLSLREVYEFLLKSK